MVQPTAAAADTSIEEARSKDVTYVFCPSEPFLQVYLSGRMVKFRSGRITDQQLYGGRPLSDDDLKYFRSNPSRFRVFVGNLRREDDRLRAAGMLQREIYTAESRRAWASDPLGVDRMGQLAMAQALSTDDGLPDIQREAPLSREAIDAIARVLPTEGAQLLEMLERIGQTAPQLARASALDQDASVIAQAAAGTDPDELVPDHIPDFTPPAAVDIQTAEALANIERTAVEKSETVPSETMASPFGGVPNS